MNLKVTNSGKHISFTPDIQKTSGSKPDKERLAKVAKDFESMLTSMMLKSMTKTTEGMFGGEESYGGGMLDSLFENELAGYISKNKSMGIAEMLYKKVIGEELKDDGALPVENNKETPQINVKKENIHGKVSPSQSSLNRLKKYEPIIEQASRTYGVDKNIIKSVILAESAANEKAQSPVKAKGLMQLMDSTARDLGVNNSWNPVENINGGTKYLSQLLRQYDGNLKLVLAAYNAGPGNVEKYKGVPPFNETKGYISRVMGYYNHLNG